MAEAPLITNHDVVTPDQAGGYQLLRRLGGAGAAMSGFVLVAAGPMQAAAAETPDAQVWEAPAQVAVAVGPPIVTNNQASANLPPVVVDHQPQVGTIDPGTLAYGPIETLIAPRSKPNTTTTNTTQLSAVTLPHERVIAPVKGQLSLLDEGFLAALAPPSTIRDIQPHPVIIDTQPVPSTTVPVNGDTATVRRPASALHISEAGVDMVARFEGWSPTVYDDATGNATIGYGHLIHSGRANGSEPTEFRQGITEERGRQLLRSDLAAAEKAVDGAVKVPLTQAEEDALDSFAYNVGGGAFASSTLVRELNDGHYDAVPSELARWNQGNGETLAGLTTRRAKEAEVWSGQQSAQPSAPNTSVTTILSQVELTAKDPIGTVGSVIGSLVSPHTLGSALLAPPKWKDGGAAQKNETARKPYMQQPFNGPAIITSEFGPRDAPTEGASSCHLGLDFALDFGDPILAARDGKVIANAFLPGANGNVVAIMHDGVVTWYSHLNERSPMAVGTVVKAGQTIGAAGSTGASTGPHLDFRVQIGVDPSRPISTQDDVNGHFVDPTGFLDGSIQNGNQFNTLRTAAVC